MSLLSRSVRGGRSGKRLGRMFVSAVALLLSALALSGCNVQATHLAYASGGTPGILAFRIKNGNGQVTSIFDSPFLPSNTVFGLVVHPSNQFVLAANQQDGTISLLEVDQTTGALTEKLPRTPAGISPGPMVLDTAGAFLYVADQSLNQILVFSVSADGKLSQVSSAQVGATPTSLTLASSGALYVSVPSFSDIYAFSVSAGALTPVCSSAGPVCLPFHVSNGVSTFATDPGGKFLYVPNPSTDTVSGFAIGSGGSLTPVPGVVFATGGTPVAAAVDPTSKFLYVVDSVAVTTTGTTTTTTPASAGISEFTIDSATGDLTPFVTPIQQLGSTPEFIRFDPDGKFMYLANAGSHSFTQLLINSNGILSLTGNSLQLGSVPRALALTK